MKVYKNAYDDANAALEIDPSHLKSIGRRGTAAFYLKNFKQAKLDFAKGM